MKKLNKGSIFIASAILACMPLALNSHVVKAEDVQTGQKKNEQTIIATTQEGQNEQTKTQNLNTLQGNQNNQALLYSQSKKEIKYAGLTPETAIQIRVHEDGPTKVKWTKDLTDQDFQNIMFHYKNYIVVGDNDVSPDQIKIDKDDPIEKDSGITESGNTNEFDLDNDVSEKEITRRGYKSTIIVPDWDFAPHGKPVGSYGESISYLPTMPHYYWYWDKNENYFDRLTTDPDDDTPPVLMEPGDHSYVSYYTFGGTAKGFLPNRWYKWKMYNYVATSERLAKNILKDKLPDDLLKRIYFDPKGEYLAEQTDEYGYLPCIYDEDLSSKDSPSLDPEYDLGEGTMAPYVKYTVSTDKDAQEIKHQAPDGTDRSENYKYLSGKYKDYDPNAGEGQEDNNAIISEPSENPGNSANDSSSNDAKSNNSTNDDAAKKKQDIDDDSSNTNSQPEDYRNTLKHNAFVYDHNGHIALNVNSKNKRRTIFITKGSYVHVLDNGRIYTIKGKKYYRIGENRYIKVANVSNKKVIFKINKKATIKAGKSRKNRVSLYTGVYSGISSKSGIYSGKYLTTTKNVTFDRCVKTKHNTFYRIKSTKYWVLASKRVRVND